MFYSTKLKKFSNVSHCFFSRKNGHSKSIYQSLNCGEGSGDSKDNIKKNLEHVAQKLELHRKDLILMNQTHSNKVIIVNSTNKKIKKFKSDALITNLKGFALGVLTADCVPIILYDKKNEIIGCIHAGWKGCFSGIIENTLNKFREINAENDIVACVGPCIGAQSYEVEVDFFHNFLKKSKENSVFFIKKNKKKLLFDIRAFVNSKLNKLGVKNIDNIDMDTFKDQDNFFSYRRSKKLNESDYGRCISTICLKT
ncbi:MAG: peptidoglycan editing factor PgeF [Pelagibacteraceae bacterium]